MSAVAFSAAAIPVNKEPSGLAHKDEKRPDGRTLIPWRGGKPLAWDVTVCTTVADSYLTAAIKVTQQEPSPNKLLIGKVKNTPNCQQLTSGS